MKIAVITAITGGFDIPKNIPLQTDIEGLDISYYLFTEKDFDSNPNYALDSKVNLNNRTKALYFKTQMHELKPQANIFIWLDGKIQITSADFIAQIILALRSDNFVMLRHPARKCIYVEANYIQMMVNKGDPYLSPRYGTRNVLNQVQEYRKQGYPPNNGLTDCSIFGWVNIPEMRKLMDNWWGLVFDEITFDQTAIQFLAWKNNIKIKPIDFKPGSFKLVKHNKVC